MTRAFLVPGGIGLTGCFFPLIVTKETPYARNTPAELTFFLRCNKLWCQSLSFKLKLEWYEVVWQTRVQSP